MSQDHNPTKGFAHAPCFVCEPGRRPNFLESRFTATGAMLDLLPAAHLEYCVGRCCVAAQQGRAVRSLAKVKRVERVAEDSNVKFMKQRRRDGEGTLWGSCDGRHVLDGQNGRNGQQFEGLGWPDQDSRTAGMAGTGTG